MNTLGSSRNFCSIGSELNINWEAMGKLIFVDFNDIYRFSRESNTYNVCGINHDVINGMAFNK